MKELLVNLQLFEKRFVTFPTFYFKEKIFIIKI